MSETSVLVINELVDGFRLIASPSSLLVWHMLLELLILLLELLSLFLLFFPLAQAVAGKLTVIL